jgi:predicted metal-dependent peptidase
MYVSFCDTQLYNRTRVDDDIQRIVSLRPKGGGGTSMESGLDELKNQNISSPVVIVLTDGHDGWSRSGGDYPFEVIWCINEGGISTEEAKDRIPYGHKVKMG